MRLNAPESSSSGAIYGALQTYATPPPLVTVKVVEVELSGSGTWVFPSSTVHAFACHPAWPIDHWPGAVGGLVAQRSMPELQ